MLISFDVSLSCPCMCISTNPGWENSRFWYLSTVKKVVGIYVNGKVTGVQHKDYATEQERYDQISDFFIRILERQNISNHTPVFIEDYAFAAKGKVFGIAENTGLLKHKLWDRGHDIQSIPPTVIKKFATGFGNADKEDMYEAFVFKTGIPLQTAITPDKKLGSPITDIVDAFYIAEYGHNMMRDVGVK